MERKYDGLLPSFFKNGENAFETLNFAVTIFSYVALHVTSETFET